MSKASPRALSLVNPNTLSQQHATHGTHAALASDIPEVQHVLGPEERLLAMLPGQDACGPVTWIATTRRLIVLTQSSDPDRDVAHVYHGCVTCVDVCTDPLGTTIRVRATGRQLRLQTREAVLATQLGSLLRERAGLVASEPARQWPTGPTVSQQQVAAQR